jgi:hypothetical protein
MKRFMNRIVSRQALSAVLIAAAFAGAGAAPASAQAVTREGSALPHYFDTNGELKWGSWGPAAAEQKAASIPRRNLYLSARPHSHLYAGQKPRDTRVR